MARRMDRYNNLVDNEPKRLSKNQELYKNIGTNKKYTNFVDVRKSNAYLIDEANYNNYTRENYQHLKEYTNITPKTRVRREFDDFNHIYNTDKNRVYDINSVLEKAKENRVNSDQEVIRKLKNTNYNILAALNPEELEKYRQEKKNRLKSDDDIKELIDTMISKTLAGEISKETGVDLLSDLMATNVFDRIDSSKEKENTQVEKENKEERKDISKDEISQEKIKKIQEESKKETNVKNNEMMRDLDQSFYTKSMDLSDKDFFIDDEEEKHFPLILKIIIFIVILILIGVGVYFLYKNV